MSEDQHPQISQSASMTVSEIAIAQIDVIAKINKHDTEIAAAQLSTPVVNGMNGLKGANGANSGTDGIH